MTVAIGQAALNLLVAVGLGATIGFERQWRHRLAGLRTNTLVALGAASFVLFSTLSPGEDSPTRVAAQVVSGIGFLGAGVIFKEGLSVRGLNTAATLWCSAAVGLLAGGGYPVYAGLAAGLVVGVNLLLRPLVSLINRQPMESAEVETSYVVTVVCKSAEEAHVRALLLHGFGNGDLHLRELDSSNIEDSERVEVTAKITSDKPREISLESIVGRLSLEQSVTAARWRSVTTLV
jgi:putative Mg2+ transporter-C (MgtC) family protein